MMLTDITCPFCTKPFGSENGFWMHVRAMHAGALAILRTAERHKSKEAWEEENAQLRERVTQLEVELYGRKEWAAPREMKLSPQQEAFVACILAHPGYRTHETLFQAINHGNAEYEGKIVAVTACKVRSKFKPFGLEVETHWSRGYGLPQATRQRLLNWPAQQAA